MVQDDSRRDSEHKRDENEPRPQGAGASGRSQGGAEQSSQGDASVISTADPTVLNPPQGPEDWQQDPNATVSVETNQIRAARPLRSGLPPMVVLAPHGQGEGDKTGKPSQGDSGRSKGEQDESEGDDQRNSQSKDAESRDDKDTGKRHEQKKREGNKKASSEQHGKGSEEEHDQDDAPDSSQREEDSHHRNEVQEQPSTMKIMLMAGAVALVCGIVGAVGYDYFFGKKSDDKDSDKQASSSDKKPGGGSQQQKSGSSKKNKGSDEEETGSASNEGQTIPGFTTTADADSLRKQIGHLSERLYAMQHRIDSLSRNREETPPDVHTLQLKMAELAQTVDEVANLPSKVRQVSNRLESLEQKLKMLRDQLTEKNDQSANRPMVVYEGGPNRTPAPAAPLSPPSEPPTGADADSAQRGDPALEQSIELLKLGVYDRAANILKRLRETEPDDPRVWYCSAIALGLTTGDWQGEAQRFAEKGVECERSGLVPRIAIDRALRGLSRTQGADWLAGYRDRVGKKS